MITAPRTGRDTTKRRIEEKRCGKNGIVHVVFLAWVFLVAGLKSLANLFSFDATSVRVNYWVSSGVHGASGQQHLPVAYQNRWMPQRFKLLTINSGIRTFGFVIARRKKMDVDDEFVLPLRNMDSTCDQLFVLFTPEKMNARITTAHFLPVLRRAWAKGIGINPAEVETMSMDDILAATAEKPSVFFCDGDSTQLAGIRAQLQADASWMPNSWWVKIASCTSGFLQMSDLMPGFNVIEAKISSFIAKDYQTKVFDTPAQTRGHNYDKIKEAQKRQEEAQKRQEEAQKRQEEGLEEIRRVTSRALVNSSRKATERIKQIMASAQTDTGMFSKLFHTLNDDIIREAWDDMYKMLFGDDVAKDANLVAAVQALKDGKFSGEDLVQVLHDSVHEFCCTQLGSSARHAIRATSARNAPVNPHHRLDATFVGKNSNSAVTDAKVYWCDVTAIVQLKKDFSKFLKDEVNVQIHDDCAELLAQQAGRELACGVAACGRFIQFWMKRSQDMICSPVMPFLLSEGGQPPTDGFAMFLCMLATDPKTLGFIRHIPVLEERRIDAAKVLDVDLKVAAIVRLGKYTKPDVHACLLDSSPACLKVFADQQGFENEMKVYSSSSSSSSDSHHLYHRTQIVAHGAQDTTSLLLVSPLAIETLDHQSFDQALFADACLTVAELLKELHGRELFYMDPSPSNALVFEKKGGSLGVVWNDFGEVCEWRDAKFSSFVGTHAYASLNWSPWVCSGESRLFAYEAIDDYQAVFFTLLKYAYTKRYLPWEEAADVKALWADKLSRAGRMMNMMELVHKDARDILSALYTAVFVNKSTDEALTILSSAQPPPVSDDLVWEGKSVFHYEEMCSGFRCQRRIMKTMAAVRLSECKRCVLPQNTIPDD